MTVGQPVDHESPDPGADDLVISTLGTRVRIRCPIELRQPLCRLLGPMISGDGPAGGHGEPLISMLQDTGGHRLIGPDGQLTLVQEGRELAEVLRLINATVIEQSAYFCAHGAVMSGADGALVILAASGVGKSTATAAGLQEGLGYLSDEVLSVEWNALDDADGELSVQPYPRPLGLSSWSCRALEIEAGAVLAEDVAEDEYYVSPTALTARINRSPRALRHIVLLAPPRAEARLVRLGRRDSVPALLQRAFNAWHDPAAAFRLAHRIAATADCWSLEPGSPRQTGKLLKEQFGGDEGLAGAAGSAAAGS